VYGCVTACRCNEYGLNEHRELYIVISQVLRSVIIHSASISNTSFTSQQPVTAFRKCRAICVAVADEICLAEKVVSEERDQERSDKFTCALKVTDGKKMEKAHTGTLAHLHLWRTVTASRMYVAT